jgi:hypothetical protein
MSRSPPYDDAYLDRLPEIAREDARHLREKEKTYQDSWKRRGGIGAFMMLARKWDRLENMLQGKYDIFAGIEQHPGGEDGTVLAEVRDLRRYLALVEAEMRQRGVVKGEATSFDYLEGKNSKGYLMDGMSAAAYLEDGLGPSSLIRVPHTDVYILNRDILPTVDLEHLPRLRYELNGPEYLDTPPEYQWMYTDHTVTLGKFVMLPQYRNMWGK